MGHMYVSRGTDRPVCLCLSLWCPEGRHQGSLSVVGIPHSYVFFPFGLLRRCHCVALATLRLRELPASLYLLIASRGVFHSSDYSCCIFSGL